MKPAPISFTQDPRKHVHFVVKLRGELRTDEVGSPGPLAPRDELHVVVIATVLSRQRGAVEGEHRADAELRRRLVDVQPLFGSAGVSPPVGLMQLPVEDVDGVVDDLRRVDAGAVG